MNELKRIRDYVFSKREEITAILRRLALIPSVYSNESALPDAPFGIECLHALQETQKVYSEYTFESALYNSGYLLSNYGNGEKTIGLFAHADVVPALDGWILTEPFNPIERDGALIGRGVCDNKSGITESLFAVDAIRALQIPLKSRIMMFTGSNEENGMADIQAYKKEKSLPDVAIVPDSAFPVYRGEKGVLRFWAKARKPMTLIRSFKGGTTFNIVLGEASVTLPNRIDIKNRLQAQCADGASLSLSESEGNLILCAKGISKHGALPEGSLNAALILMQTLLSCNFLPDDDREQIAFLCGLLSDYYGRGFDGNADFLSGKGLSANDPDFGNTTAINGIIDMYDGCIRVAFDVRFVNVNSEEMITQINNVLNNADFDMEIVRNSPGYKALLSDPTLKTLLSAYEECTGTLNPVPYVNAGGTYARYLKNAFSIGTTVCNAKISLPGGHGGVHQPDEMIDINGHLEAIVITAWMIIRLDRMLNN